MSDDGTRRGVRCAARDGERIWCSRDAGHPGAHESRSSHGPGLIAWRNEASSISMADRVEAAIATERDPVDGAPV